MGRQINALAEKQEEAAEALALKRKNERAARVANATGKEGHKISIRTQNTVAPPPPPSEEEQKATEVAKKRRHGKFFCKEEQEARQGEKNFIIIIIYIKL